MADAAAPAAPRFRPDPEARRRAWALGESAIHFEVAAWVAAVLTAGFGAWTLAQDASRYAWGASWTVGFGLPGLIAPLFALVPLAWAVAAFAARRLRRALAARRQGARRRLSRLALLGLAGGAFSLLGGLGTLAAWARDQARVPADAAVPLAVLALVGGLPAPWAGLLWRRSGPMLSVPPAAPGAARGTAGASWTCPACTRSYTLAGAAAPAPGLRCPQCP